MGAYVSADNTIYIARELEPREFMHTLWHELKHVFDEQVADLVMRSQAKDPEEAGADAFGALMSNLFPQIKNIEDLIGGK